MKEEVLTPMALRRQFLVAANNLAKRGEDADIVADTLGQIFSEVIGEKVKVVLVKDRSSKGHTESEVTP